MLAYDAIQITTLMTRSTSLVVALVAIVGICKSVSLRKKLGVSIPWAMTGFTLIWLSVLATSLSAAIILSSRPISVGFYVVILGAAYTWSIAGLAWHVLYFVRHASSNMLIPITKLADTLVTIEKEARGKT